MGVPMLPVPAGWTTSLASLWALGSARHCCQLVLGTRQVGEICRLSPRSVAEAVIIMLIYPPLRAASLLHGALFHDSNL